MRTGPLAAAALLLLSTACADDSPGSVTLRVLAASSLTDVLTDLGLAYQQGHPGVRVRFVFGGSQELATDLEGSDAVAFSDVRTVTEVAKQLGPYRIVARNSLTIAVAPGNPHHVRGLASLADPRLKVVLGSSAGPVGRYSREALRKAGVRVRPLAEEIDARTVLSRVRTGEADAGIVYITDMKSAGAAASSVAIPAVQNPSVAYPAAVVRSSGHPAAAGAFVAWLASPEARTRFNSYGFQSP